MTQKIIHYFDCPITDFHKYWDRFTVNCGITINKNQVEDNFRRVTCLKCLEKHSRNLHKELEDLWLTHYWVRKNRE